MLAALALSASGFVGIALFEGFSASTYIPLPGDKPTIGFGTTDGVAVGDTVTPMQALSRALVDISEYEGAIKHCVKVPMHQYEYDAFVSLAYNIGPGSFCRSTLVKKLNSGDYTGACAEIKRWHFANGQSVQGLINRREAEYKRCMGLQ
ncbi:lysozyme [Aestuariicella hydrocarbonica]|uniref:Lysozyme n=2 Tax=Pseudomaricurvus hydrocarbonicus TaxID=1470433 RepID=A0A9E5JYQ0_9GAMM|nr:lysozyme [Aestuariicella hydrocarbonica]NHO64637.1 lysozyme [Aestuariicella hydrocarbonica]